MLRYKGAMGIGEVADFQSTNLRLVQRARLWAVDQVQECGTHGPDGPLEALRDAAGLEQLLSKRGGIDDVGTDEITEVAGGLRELGQAMEE